MAYVPKPLKRLRDKAASPKDTVLVENQKLTLQGKWCANVLPLFLVAFSFMYIEFLCEEMGAMF